MTLPSKEELFSKAEKLLKLYDQMNETFGEENRDQHLIMVLISGLQDLYNHGYADGYKCPMCEKEIGREKLINFYYFLKQNKCFDDDAKTDGHMFRMVDNLTVK